MLLSPFKIIWELIEFGLQALFVYVLVIIIFIGVLFIVLKDNKATNNTTTIEYVEVTPYIYKKVEQECKRPAGCRILEDGTVEY